MKRYTIVEFTHDYLKNWIKEGSLWIDATAGNGHDTAFLCERVGQAGKVIAFDIQEQAMENTRKRLESLELMERCQLVLNSHEHMMDYAGKETVDGIVFNLGYLPGGDHKKATKATSSVSAIKTGLECLKPGGIMCICVYSGQDTGFEEKNAVLQYMKEINSKEYLVIVSEFYNRPNCPPIPIFILKL